MIRRFFYTRVFAVVFIVILVIYIILVNTLHKSPTSGESNFNTRKILIISPHEDDETIACAGVIRKAVKRGDDVRLMLATNGDERNLAETRLNESINSMAKLGLSKGKIYYLSYGDYNVLINAFFARDPALVFLSKNGTTQQTYGFPALLTDYHYLKYGAHASYCRQNIITDFYSIINDFRPKHIYMPSAFELTHGDHAATAFFTIEALIKIRQTSPQYTPVIHTYMIYKEGLPQKDIDFNALPVPVSNTEADMNNTSPYNWSDRESVSVPDEMYAPITPQKMNLLTSNIQIKADDSCSAKYNIKNAFDDNQNTTYTSNGMAATTTITLSFLKSIAIEKIRLLIGESGGSIIDGSLEAANNPVDLDRKNGSYHLVFANNELAGGWHEFNTKDAITCRIWRFKLHKQASDRQVSIPEIEFYSTNLKASALREYQTQFFPYYERFIRSDEVFWKRPFSSLSYHATVTASSEDVDFNQGCKNVTDGIFLGYPYRHDKEWVTVREKNNAWLKLSWPNPITANRIVLYDRPDLQENILEATLTFSDGSSIPVYSLPKNGSRLDINFPTKIFNWVMLTINKAEGARTGLAEFEVCNRDVNVAPQARVIVSSQNVDTGQLGAKAIDEIVDGYPKDLTREWSSIKELGGAWLKLDWQQYQIINQIILYDKPNLKDNILSARLVFSDGSVIKIGPLNNAGKPYSIKVGPQKINWVKLEILKATGSNTGLAEFEVYGYPEDPEVYNIASLSRVTASSSEANTSQSRAIKVVDGKKTGLANNEWITATETETDGAWLKLNWEREYYIDKIILYDRPNLNDNINSSILQLSDGSIFYIHELPKDGTGAIISIQKNNIKWVKYIIKGADGLRTGLSEIEVHGKKAD
jgi:LmbE family N-acetylglucosaminyl deacetylase